MQCCLILSEMKRHSDAVIHAKKGTRKALKIIVNEIILIFCYYLSNFEDSNSTTNSDAKRGMT